jgi:hypothetical protein
MDSVFFGLTPASYDSGTNGRVAINSNNDFVEVHQSTTTFGGLWYWCGNVDGVVMNFSGHDGIQNSDADNDGYNPAVAVVGSTVIEVHDSGGISPSLYFWIGQIQNNHTVNWITNTQYDDGANPTVAANHDGVIIEVHRAGTPINNDLWWSTFRLNVTNAPTPLQHGKISGAGLSSDSGFDPSVAVNNKGIVVEVHCAERAGASLGVTPLWYWIGQLQMNNTISWIGHAQYDVGNYPSVTIDDNNMVYEIHQTKGGGTLWQRVGQAVITNGVGSINWFDYFGQGQTSYQFDSGYLPAIGGNGSTVVQVHQSTAGVGPSLYGNAALIFDRGNWMGNNLHKLGPLPLNKVAMPASHDSAMYIGGFDTAILGKTQDLSIYGQLLDGTRYFDLRPGYDDDSETFYLHHGSIKGPALSDVLNQVAQFLGANPAPKELIILKFSHYADFGEPVNASNAIFMQMVEMITDTLGNWLYTAPVPAGQRLAAYYPMIHFIGSKGCVLVVCEQVPSQCATGIYSYRDWYAPDPSAGDLTVFDCYSDTSNLTTMMTSTGPNEVAPTETEVPGLPRGQIPKFQGPGLDDQTDLYDGFTGQCYSDSSVPCDLFLLSWTLTSWIFGTYVWTFAADADAALVDYIPSDSGNKFGRMINLIYVDYVEYARSVDLAYLRNGLA